jgi:hypothetical protein
MRSIWITRLTKCSLAVAAAVALALPAAAQESKGSFTLAREVHWSTVTLAPGTYHYNLMHDSPLLVVCVRPADGGTGQFLMADAVTKPSAHDANRLTIEQRSGGWYVTAMDLADDDLQLQFRAPKNTAMPVADASTAKTTTIASK